MADLIENLLHDFDESRLEPDAKVYGARCSYCPLKERTLVPSYGPPPGEAKWVLVGEAPGYTEARPPKGEIRRPFIGDSGKLLRADMKVLGMDPDDAFMTNTALCHPPGNKIPPEASQCCRWRLAFELAPYWDSETPICGMGVVPTHTLVPGWGKKSLSGRWFYDGRVLCTWHPAYILRVTKNYTELHLDLMRLKRGRPQEVAPVTYKILETPREIERRLGELTQTHAGRVICLDLETDQLIRWEHQILCFAIAYEDDEAYVVPQEFVYHEATRDALIKLFDSDVLIMGHTIKFDLRNLWYQLGVTNARADYDSLVAHYVLDENMMHGLKPLLSRYLDVGDYEGELVQKYLRSKADYYSKIPRPQLYKYNVLDVCYNLRLWRIFEAKLKEEGLWERPFLFPLMYAHQFLLRMEMEGVPVDKEAMEKLEGQLASAISFKQTELERLCGRQFNPNSWKQVGVIMYDHYHMPQAKGRGFKPRTTRYEARVAIMDRLDKDSEAFKWLEGFGELKSLVKLKSSYVTNMPPKISPVCKVHPDYLLYGARTGRLSVRDPAIQTIPRPGTGSALGETWGQPIKAMFTGPLKETPYSDNWGGKNFSGEWLSYDLRRVARGEATMAEILGEPEPDDMVIMSCDYSQVEMRIAAALSQDDWLMQLYQEGRDIHSELAVIMFGPDYTKDERNTCKKFNYAYLYGGTEHSFALEEGLDIAIATRFVRRYKQVATGLSKWHDEQFRLMQTQGYVETLLGRRRRFPIITRDNRKDAIKAAKVQGPQGLATDFNLISAVVVDKWIREQGFKHTHVIILVHDSIVLRLPRHMVPIVAPGVVRIMEEVCLEYIPNMPWVVDVEVGDDWGHIKPIDLESEEVQSWARVATY